MKYNIALKEKRCNEGLRKHEIIHLVEMVDDTEVLPLYVQDCEAEATALGFISVETAKTIDNFDMFGLREYLSSILNNRHSDDDANTNVEEYEYLNLKIWIGKTYKESEER